MSLFKSIWIPIKHTIYITKQRVTEGRGKDTQSGGHRSIKVTNNKDRQTTTCAMKAICKAEVQSSFSYSSISVTGIQRSSGAVAMGMIWTTKESAATVKYQAYKHAYCLSSHRFALSQCSCHFLLHFIKIKSHMLSSLHMHVFGLLGL